MNLRRATRARAGLGMLGMLTRTGISASCRRPDSELTSGRNRRRNSDGPTNSARPATTPIPSTSGGLGNTGAPGYGPYSAAKEAVRSLTRTAAREWGRDGITVNCVCPASVAHRMQVVDPDSPRGRAFAAMYEDHPLGRDGDAEADIAPAVAFLLSDASQYVTGQTLMVDGGGIMRA